MTLRSNDGRTLAACVAASLVLHASLLVLPGNQYAPGGLPFPGSAESLVARIVGPPETPSAAPPTVSPPVIAAATAPEPAPARAATPAPIVSDTSNVGEAPGAGFVAPVRPKGSGAAGLSTIRDGYAPIEVLGSWWDQKYGPLPDPATIPAEPKKDIELGYPPDAPRGARAARVVVAIAISALGKVEDVFLISGDPPWSAYAEGELREVKFDPARLDGEAVPSFLVYAIEFVPIRTVPTPK